MSQQYPVFQARDKIRPGDFKELLWVQYQNCINSGKIQQSESRASQGNQMFSSFPSVETFELNVSILQSMMEGYGLIDKTFTASLPSETMVRKYWGKRDCPHGEYASCNCTEVEVEVGHSSTTLFAGLTRILKERVFAERTADLGRI